MDIYKLRQVVLGQVVPRDASAGATDQGMEDLLSYLIQFEGVRRRLAEYPHLDPVILEALSQDEHLHVKMAAARNPNTPSAALGLLEQGPARAALAQNPATPLQVLRKLACDGDLDIRRGLAENPACPADILFKLGQNQDLTVLKALAENPNAPSELLEDLATRGNASLCRALSHNPNLPRAVFLKLLQCSDPVVQNLLTRRIPPPMAALADPQTPGGLDPVPIPRTSSLKPRSAQQVTHCHPH